jgi:hypothetical protein
MKNLNSANSASEIQNQAQTQRQSNKQQGAMLASHRYLPVKMLRLSAA